MINIIEISDRYRKYVIRKIEESWGSSIIVSRGRVHDVKYLEGFIAIEGQDIKGIIIYNIEKSDCEITLLESFHENCGIGSRLIEKIVSVAKEKECDRLWLITTNDNTKAMRFYQRRGFDMVAIHRNALEESRKIKPEIPLNGIDDIPIKHEIEMELAL